MNDVIFVFGSNLAGQHDTEVALFAHQHCRPVDGVGEGRTGQAYAIPTRDENLKTLPLYKINRHINSFIVYAKLNPQLRFYVTKIGCGSEGYTQNQIAPMFKFAPDNCRLPDGWREYHRWYSCLFNPIPIPFTKRKPSK